MTLSEITDYLQKDLRQSVLDDVAPCLLLGVPRGGYFSVPRLVLGYVDYLGALYRGYSGNTTRTGRRIFAKGEYAKTFLHDVFGQINNDYVKYGDLLWEIYRNGPIHLYEPLNLRNSTSIIQWQVVKTKDRSAIVPIKIATGHKRMLLVHLLPMLVERNEWIQPVMTGCLYDDLLSALDLYAAMIQKNSSLESKFRNTVNSLLVPETTDLTW